MIVKLLVGRGARGGGGNPIIYEVWTKVFANWITSTVWIEVRLFRRDFYNNDFMKNGFFRICS